MAVKKTVTKKKAAKKAAPEKPADEEKDRTESVWGRAVRQEAENCPGPLTKDNDPPWGNDTGSTLD